MGKARAHDVARVLPGGTHLLSPTARKHSSSTRCWRNYQPRQEGTLRLGATPLYKAKLARNSRSG
jgi:hypothetical protein